MNQEKCCENCTTINDKGIIRRTNGCLDNSCPCHTSPKEEIVNDWEDGWIREWYWLIKFQKQTEQEFVDDIIHRQKLLLSSTEKRVAKDIVGEIEKKIPRIIKINTKQEKDPFNKDEVITIPIDQENAVELSRIATLKTIISEIKSKYE